MTDGPPIEVAGLLLRDGAGFVLCADDGRRLRLELSRTPVDLVEKRARVAGRLGAGDVVSVDAIGPARPAQ